MDRLTKKQIIKEIEKFRVDEIPENLIEDEVKILSQGMGDEDAKKNKKNFEEVAKKRIKVGLVLNEFGEKNQKKNMKKRSKLKNLPLKKPKQKKLAKSNRKLYN